MFLLNNCVCLTPDEARFVRDALDALADKCDEYSDPDDTAGKFRNMALQIRELVKNNG